MSKENNSTFHQIIKPTLVLGVICLVTALLLALVNQVTSAVIQQQELEKQIKAKQMVMPLGISFETQEFPAADGSESFTFDKALDANGELIGYVFKTSSQGYGGPVVLNIGIDTEGLITGVKTLELSETPNIGMKVAEPEFTDQFVGKTEGVSSTKSTPGDNEIQAVSGATRSTNAVMDSVTLAFEQYKLVAGGGND